MHFPTAGNRDTRTKKPGKTLWSKSNKGILGALFPPKHHPIESNHPLCTLEIPSLCARSKKSMFKKNSYRPHPEG